MSLRICLSESIEGPISMSIIVGGGCNFSVWVNVGRHYDDRERLGCV